MRHLRFVMGDSGSLRAVLWSTVSTRATPEQVGSLLRGITNSSSSEEACSAGVEFTRAAIPDWRVEPVGGRATAESFRFRSVVLTTPEGVEYEVEVNTDPDFGSPLCAVAVDINRGSTYLAASIVWEAANAGLYMPREYHSWYEETTGGSVRGPHPDPSVIWRNRDEREEEAAASSS